MKHRARPLLLEILEPDILVKCKVVLSNGPPGFVETFPLDIYSFSALQLVNLQFMKPYQKWIPRKCHETILKGNKENAVEWKGTGLKTGGNMSYGEQNPPQSLDLNIIEAAWYHLNKKQNKRQQTKKERLTGPPRSLDNYS